MMLHAAQIRASSAHAAFGLALATIALAAGTLPGLAQSAAPNPFPGLVVSMPPSPTAPPAGVVVSTTPVAPKAAPPVALPKPKPAALRAAKPSKPRQSARVTRSSPAPSRTGGSSIVALVNDQPITSYEIERRSRFMALSTNIADRARANMKSIAQDPQTNQRLKAILQETIQANPGKSREQIVAAFEKRKQVFVLGLQRQAVSSARASILPGLKTKALEELIEEKLKLGAARQERITILKDDIERVFESMSQRNQMTPKQFEAHIRNQGADPGVIKERLKTSLAWREVVRKRFGHQINVNERDIEQLAAAAGGAEVQEVRLHRITIATPGNVDQRAMTERLADATALRSQFRGCKTTAGLAKGRANTKFEDLGFRKISSISEPTRSLLPSASEGEMLPANLAADGVELYAVCGRRMAGIDPDKRQEAQSQLTMKEFEKVAQRYLHNLRRDALIEMR